MGTIMSEEIYEKRKRLHNGLLLQFKKEISNILDREDKSLIDLIGLGWNHVKYIFDGETSNTLVDILTEICLKFGYRLEIKFVKIKDE